MIETMLTVWLVAAIAAMAVSTRAGLCIYLAYFLLVPFCKLSIFGVILQQNAVLAMLLAIFLIKNHDRIGEIDLRVFAPFVFLFGFYLVMMVYQTDLDKSVMLGNYRVDVMTAFILPVIIWNAVKFDREVLKPLVITLLVCIALISAYGLWLTRTPGINPWLMAVLPTGGMEFLQEYAEAEGTGRMYGRIFSVFLHPMTFGLFLCMSFTFITSLRHRLGVWLYVVLMALIVIDIVTCGVRSALLAMIVTVAFMLVKAGNLRSATAVAAVALLVGIVMSNNPGLGDYIESAVNLSKTADVGGSSIELRQYQLTGCFAEIKNCMLQGHGYSWTKEYMATHQRHPDIMAFESLVYVVLCNNGVLGIIAWIVTVVMIFLRNPSNIYLQSLVVAYVSFSCFTGEYSYLQYMLVFYVLLSVEGIAPSAELLTEADG